jgi:hypothetical protein
VGFLWIIILGCSPSKKQEPPPVAGPPVAAGDKGQQSAVNSQAPAQDEAARFARRYNEGEVVLETDDPTIVFVARFEDVGCAPLPERRPEGFEAVYWRRTAKRGHAPASVYSGLSSSVCHFQRTLHFDAPPVRCAVLDDAAFDALYARLRALDLHTIQTTRSKGGAHHRGGFGVSMRWPGVRCKINNSFRSKVVEASRPAFDSALDALRDAYRAAKPARRPSPQPDSQVDASLASR